MVLVISISIDDDHFVIYECFCKEFTSPPRGNHQFSDAK